MGYYIDTTTIRPGKPILADEMRTWLETLDSAIRAIADTEVNENTVPPGTVVPWAGTTAPSGWLLCFGQAVSRTTYALLFGNIGTTYGAGDGVTTFNLPDLRGCFPLGKDDMGGVAANRVTATQAKNLGQRLGSEWVTLTISQIPTHDHPHFHYLPHHNATSGTVGVVGTTAIGNDPPAAFTHENSPSPVGGGQPHNNMPPSLTMNYIIKT